MDSKPDGGGVAANPHGDAAPGPIPLSARRVAVALDAAARAPLTTLVAEPRPPAVVLQSAMFGTAPRAGPGRTGTASAFAKEFQLAGSGGLGA